MKHLIQATLFAFAILSSSTTFAQAFPGQSITSTGQRSAEARLTIRVTLTSANQLAVNASEIIEDVYKMTFAYVSTGSPEAVHSESTYLVVDRFHLLRDQKIMVAWGGDSIVVEPPSQLVALIEWKPYFTEKAIAKAFGRGFDNGMRFASNSRSK